MRGVWGETDKVLMNCDLTSPAVDSLLLVIGSRAAPLCARRSASEKPTAPEALGGAFSTRVVPGVPPHGGLLQSGAVGDRALSAQFA